MDRRRLREAVVVFAAALVLRAGWLVRQGPPPPPAGDAAEYHSYATSLAATGRFEREDGARATRMPGYPLFLAAVYSVAGPSPRAAHWVQCVLGALTCLLIYLWALQALRPPWALACGLAAAAYFDLIAPTGWLLTECLYGFLLAGSFFVLSCEAIPGPARGVLGGICLGAAYLVRPEITPFAAAILAAAPWLYRRLSKRDALAGLAALAVIASLWVGRNALVLRRFVPTNTVGGFNLYLGLRLPLEHQSLDLGPFQSPAEGLDEFSRDAFFLQNYRDLRARVPLKAKLKGYAFNFLTLYYPFLPQYDWTYVLLVPFWLAGLWAARARRELWPAAALVVGLSAVFAVLAGPVSRYRFGFSPCLIVLAGLGAQSLQERARGSRRFAWGLAGWTALNLAVWLGAAQARGAALWLKTALWR